MTPKKLSLDELRDLIHTGEATDPLVFLETLMTGQDPRNVSKIFDLVCEIDEFTGGDISKEDWDEVVSCVRTRYKYSHIPVSESHSAAVTLASFLYPKRKQVEMSGGVSYGDDVKASPLSEEEIGLFREKFNDEF